MVASHGVSSMARNTNMNKNYMELPVQTYTLLAVLIFLALWFLHPFKRKAHNNLPPGWLGWPVIGETLEFFSMGKKGVPQQFIHDRMSRYSSQVFKTSLLREPTIVFCGPAGNKFLFSNESTLVQSWWPHSINKIFPGLGSSIGEETQKMKMFLPRFLNPSSIHKYIGVMDLIAKQELNLHWDGKYQVTVMPRVKKYTFSIACRLFLGIEDEDHINKFYDRYEKILVGILSLPINILGTPYYRAVKESNLVRKELREIIKKRKTDVTEKRILPIHDLFTDMLNDPGENEVFTSEEDVTSKLSAMLVASYDGPGRILTFLVKYLAELPHVYNQVLKEQTEILDSKEEEDLLNWEDIQRMRYSANVVNEVLRLVPPTQGTFREAITDFTYAGFSIPKGWKIYWNAYSTHNDPNYFPDPERFDPSRFERNPLVPYTFVPFGGGPRQCPGMQYGKSQILVFLHNLVTRFRWEKLIPDERKMVDPLPRTSNGLPVRLWPHEPKVVLKHSN